MNIVIITPETLVDHEIATCNELLHRDVRLHVRKPTWSFDEVKKYIEQIDSKHYQKISLHQAHPLVDEMNLGGIHQKSQDDGPINPSKVYSKSFHSLRDISRTRADLNYGFLSPIYDSISKQNYLSHFDLDKLQSELRRIKSFPLYALGGVMIDHHTELEDIGFDGMVLLGSFWKHHDIESRLHYLNK
ncbi:hypothetical protein BFP72_07315 [Reichenbachiella sp. 5M10]|uniref:thiamine phosphate synthase n=1 Tax=Reichenbachiella sp. 5M10 TaxID=1889772 RepID=UPI000C145C43|nr:thiamine phosphate synthase [Reichenbachiella sp. 5M10]PIB35218.1 hypothetical protein BFP72_07315 [Reichenbachiella sp. 5M10]